MMGSACEVKICICYNSAKSKPALDQVLLLYTDVKIPHQADLLQFSIFLLLQFFTGGSYRSDAILNNLRVTETP